MPRRLLSLLLALLTLWSAFATQEATFTAWYEDGTTEIVSASSLQERLQDGSIDDHHLDDQPVQFHLADAALDQALVPPDCRVPSTAPVMVAPHGTGTQQRPAPFLEGPKRPPKALSFSA